MSSAAPAPIARWLDRAIVLLWAGNLGWVVWHFGGFSAQAMTLGLPLIFTTGALMALRWWVVAPTGAPRGWWYPLPVLGWVLVHMMAATGVAELTGRAQLHGWHLWSALLAYWLGLHVVGRAGLRRAVLASVGMVTLMLVAVALYQRLIDPSWLPMGRVQVNQYLGRSSGTFGGPNLAAAWLGLVLPVAVLWGWRAEGGPMGRILAAVVALAALVGIGLSFSRGGILATSGACALAWLFHSRRSWAWRLGPVIGLAVLGSAGLWWSYQHVGEVQQRVDSLIEHRGERTRPLLWGVAIDLWQERPITGWGGGSYGALMERHRPEGLWETAYYAHNDYLNYLSDYGVVGAALLLLAAGCVGCAWRRRSDPVAGVGIGLGALALALLLDFQLHAPAILWLASLGVALGMGRAGERDPVAETKPLHLAGGMLVVAATLVLPWLQARPLYQAEQWRWEARELLNDLGGEPDRERIREVAREATVRLQRAVAQAPQLEQAWMDLSYAISLQGTGIKGNQTGIGREAEAAARRALAASDEVAEHWLRLGVALDLQGRWAEAGTAYGRAVTLAPRQPVMWYYQGFHFSLKPSTHALAKAALATCLRLDPWYEEAKMLRADLERAR